MPRIAAPTVADLSNGGNGCDETLTWWVTDYLAPPDPNQVPEEPEEPRRGAQPRHPSLPAV